MLRTRSRVVAGFCLAVSVVAVGTGVAPSTSLASGDPPVSNDDAYIGRAGRTISVNRRMGLLRNDTDAEGDVLTVRLAYGGASYGTVDLRPDGAFTYVPNGAVEYDSFSYQAFDGTSWSVPSRVTLTSYPDPVAVDDRYATLVGETLAVEAPGPMVNDTLGRPPSRLQLRSTTRRGRLMMRADGSFTYRPRAAFTGTDSFTYEIIDAGGLRSGTAKVTLRVVASNALPVAVDDRASVAEDTLLTVPAPGVLDNDRDADGDPLAIEIVDYPNEGIVDVTPDGGFTFQTALNQDNDDSFTYRVRDDFGWSNLARVSIDVIAVNDPPIAQDDYFDWTGDGPMVVGAPGVLANDEDPVEADNPIVWALITPPSVGKFEIARDGGFSWRFPAGFVGCESFVYQVGDSSPGFSATAALCVYE